MNRKKAGIGSASCVTIFLFFLFRLFSLGFIGIGGFHWAPALIYMMDHDVRKTNKQGNS